jgi:serine/threonine protein kinase
VVAPGADADVTIGPSRAATEAVTPPRTPASSRFAPGSIIAGRYRLVALLGKGGMGEVYRAENLTLDHPVTLKFLPVHRTPAGSDVVEGDEVARLAVPQRAADRSPGLAQERLPSLRPRRSRRASLSHDGVRRR